MADTKITEAAQGVVDGTLADKIKNNSRYVMTGIVLGTVIGVMAAGYFGKNKIVFGLIGAASFGAGGYLLNNKDEDDTVKK